MIWEIDIAASLENKKEFKCQECGASVNYSFKRDDGTIVKCTKLDKHGDLPSAGVMASANMLPVPGANLDKNQYYLFCNSSCRDNFNSKKRMGHPMTDLPGGSKKNEPFVRKPEENQMGAKIVPVPDLI